MSRTRIVILSALAALVLLGGAVWWFVFRDTSPPPPSLADVTTTLAGTGTTTDGGPETTSGQSVDIEGQWSLSGDGTSYVGYRVQEELASIGAKTAVGRTPLVVASLAVVGNRVTEVTIDADLTGLESDDSRRDGAIRHQALETSTFPDAGFRLGAPIDLPASAADGEAVVLSATGELTLHGVTRTVDVSLEAQLVDGRIVVVGTVPILFGDYEIEKPTSMAVLSVDDNGTVELLLVFEPMG